MFIEKLSFQVSPPERLEQFIETDAKIWDPWLRTKKGFLRKTYTRYPDGRVDIRVFWARKSDVEAAAKDPSMSAREVQFQASFLGVYHRLP